MKQMDVRQKSAPDLQVMLATKRQELTDLRLAYATQKSKQHHKLGQTRKQIAQLLTLLRERQLVDAQGGNDG